MAPIQAPINTLTFTIKPAVNALAFAVQVTVNTITLSIQTTLNSIPFAIESRRQAIFSLGFGPIGGPVKPIVYTLTAVGPVFR